MQSPEQAPSPPVRFRPERAIEMLSDAFYDPVEPARFPETRLRFRNDLAAARIGLETLSDGQWIAHFGRFEPLAGSLPVPLALRYHGHQFRSYNPDIGDGRGFLFAQARGDDGRLLDLGTKGSGQTPYSRFGDGRLTLKGGVREILATEMLAALGVETSASLSLIETGEALERGDEPSPTRSAVLVRLSHSHIRIGTFQRLAWFRETDAMAALVRYVLVELFAIDAPADPAAGAVRMLAEVVRRTARLAASYMAAGFVHGVLNSDNINVTGESFDYGPWRFAPRWEGGFTAAYFDHHGLYAFGRQAQAIHWNVVQLAAALRLVAEEAPLADALDAFPAAYEAALCAAMLWRLGLEPRGTASDLEAIAALEAALVGSAGSVDRVFFDLRGKQRVEDPALAEALAPYAVRPGALDHPYWSDAEPCSMLIEEVETLWAAIAERDDWTPFERKIAAIRRMGAACGSPPAGAVPR